MSGAEERLTSGDVRQQPRLLRVQKWGNFFTNLRNIFGFRKIVAIFNSRFRCIKGGGLKWSAKHLGVI
jgi:hypothetical protein